MNEPFFDFHELTIFNNSVVLPILNSAEMEVSIKCTNFSI